VRTARAMRRFCCRAVTSASPLAFAFLMWIGVAEHDRSSFLTCRGFRANLVSGDLGYHAHPDSVVRHVMWGRSAALSLPGRYTSIAQR